MTCCNTWHSLAILLLLLLLQDSKDLLHFFVSAAQRALLNPDTPTDIFARDADSAAAATSTRTSSSSIGSNADSADDLKFTRNVVVLEITGADVDLALIALPGIIQTEQGDDGSNVELVKQLVEQYISSSRSIIVATITCKDDIDNQVSFEGLGLGLNLRRTDNKQGSMP